MSFKNIGKTIKNGASDILSESIKAPAREMVVNELTTMTTTLGDFIIQKVKGLLQRSISFQVGISYGDEWMEESLYTILYRYNNIKKYKDLILTVSEEDVVYYRLKDGLHHLKYRNYDIDLFIDTEQAIKGFRGKIKPVRNYTIITYDLSEKFVKDFEADMLRNRNSALKLNPSSPFTNVYQDEYDEGYTYWWKTETIPKRYMNTIYIPREDKLKLANTINGFFERKQFYIDNGIPHNLKILLYGPPGSGYILASVSINY